MVDELAAEGGGGCRWTVHYSSHGGGAVLLQRPHDSSYKGETEDDI